MDFSDQPRPVRSGEELNQEALENYLSKHLPGWQGPPQIKQFPSGYSNLTYLITGKLRQLVLRRPPFGSKVKKAHDMGREYFVLSKLKEAYPLVPPPLLYCEDEEVIGASFYIMERVQGIILRRDLPANLTINAEQARTLSLTFIDNLARLHNIDYQAVGLSDWGRPQGYVERQVNGWIKRYQGSQTDEIPEVEQISKWLTENMPAESGAAVIHNDYKYDNLILDPQDLSKIIGVLDWEMATIGDPLMDLGSALGYWINLDDSREMQQLRMVPTTLPGTLSRYQLVERYAEKTGADVSNILFYYSFALFKIAVIVQQIYYRFVQGFTKDERFRQLIEHTKGFTRAAVQAVEAGRY